MFLVITKVRLLLANVERLLQMHSQRLVLVDETYADFGGESAVGSIGRYLNSLVVHPLPKSRWLTGWRIGYACGQAQLVDALERVRTASTPARQPAYARGVDAVFHAAPH